MSLRVGRGPARYCSVPEVEQQQFGIAVFPLHVLHGMPGDERLLGRLERVGKVVVVIEVIGLGLRYEVWPTPTLLQPVSQVPPFTKGHVGIKTTHL